jgi:hypothetical protein
VHPEPIVIDPAAPSGDHGSWPALIERVLSSRSMTRRLVLLMVVLMTGVFALILTLGIIGQDLVEFVADRLFRIVGLK